MKDILIPVGLLLFIGFFAFAIIHSARKQKQANAALYQEFANKHGLRYQQQDSGEAQSFARDFDGIGRFNSPSLGKVIPKTVVTGISNNIEIILFSHSTRFAEGWAREWFVAGVKSDKPIAERCSLQFCKTKSGKDSIYLEDRVLKEKKVKEYNMVVRAADSSYAGKLLDDILLQNISDLAAKLSFRPEIQFRKDRVIVYPADRNVSVNDVDMLDELLKFAINVIKL